MIGQTMSEKKVTDGKFPGWISGRRASLVFQRSLRLIPGIAEFLIHRITLDPDQLIFFCHNARAKLEAMKCLAKEISKRFLFYTYVHLKEKYCLCDFSAFLESFYLLYAMACFWPQKSTQYPLNFFDGFSVDMLLKQVMLGVNKTFWSVLYDHHISGWNSLWSLI